MGMSWLAMTFKSPAPNGDPPPGIGGKPARPLAALAGIVALLLAGCQDGLHTYAVTGQVTYADGSPLPGGVIELKSVQQEGISAKGEIGPDGTFSALSTFAEGDGAVAGEHLVMIAPLPRSGAEGGPRLRNSIDPRYLSFHTSGLRVTVSETESNEFHLEVHPPRRSGFGR